MELPYLNLPSRNITARSYSDTTLKQINKENGRVISISTTAATVASTSTTPKSSFSAKKFYLQKNRLINKC